MTIKKSQADSILVARCGAMLSYFEKSTATDGSNTETIDPLRHALRRLGYTVVNISSVTDTDLSACDVTYEEALLDLAELRLLQNLQTEATLLVDTSIGPRRESYSQLALTLEKIIGQRTEAIKESHGWAVGQTLTTGVVTIGFVEDGTNEY